MRKNVKWITMLLAVTLLFTSCGTGSGTGNKGETGEVRDSINLTLNQVVETLNPYGSQAIIDTQFYTSIYETLFFFNDKGELEPRLGESYELQDDNMTYVVHLRQGVKFHDGTEMKAEDVAWSLDYELKSGPYTTKRAILSDFESAVAIDDYTVEIKSVTPSASFFNNINMNGYILQKAGYLAAGEDIGLEWLPIGTGPYTVTSYNPDSEIQLQSFADYYRGKARIDKINYKILTDNNTITTAFESGELDFIVAPTANYARLSENDNYVTYLSPTNHTSFFHVNVNNGDALSKKLVRQAISYAIDREAMCIAAYDGIAQPAYSLFNPDSVVGGFTVEELEAAGIPSYQYNPEKAKELLAEAGYADGVDIGVILTINGSYWEKMSTVFQANMAAVGITVNIELADSAACRSRRKEHDYQLATTGTNFSPDASYSYMYYHLYTAEELAAGNYTELGISDVELDALYRKAASELDETARRDIFLEINRKLQDELYTIPTFHKQIPYAYKKGLTCDVINTNYYFVYNFSWTA